MSALENVVADAVLILSTNLGYVVPHDVDVVEKVVAVITFVLEATQFAHAWYFEEGYRVYARLQDNLRKRYTLVNVTQRSLGLSSRETRDIASNER